MPKVTETKTKTARKRTAKGATKSTKGATKSSHGTKSATKKTAPASKLSLRARIVVALAKHGEQTREGLVALGVTNGARRAGRQERSQETPLFEAIRPEGSRALVFRLTAAGKRAAKKPQDIV